MHKKTDVKILIDLKFSNVKARSPYITRFFTMKIKVGMIFALYYLNTKIGGFNYGKRSLCLKVEN